MTRKSWRDIYPVHPAADVFPMMTEEELRDLGKDIKKNGLRQPVVLWREVMGYRNPDEASPEKSKLYLLDGRNRLDAMELVGLSTVTRQGQLRPERKLVSAKRFAARMASEGLSDFEERSGDVPDPTAYVISANIKRRHLSKKQQADLIVKVVESAKSTDLAKMAKSVKRTNNGRVQGSTKDPVKTKVLEEAEKNDISKRTAERAIADHRASAGETSRKYVTCPECSARVADLDKHLKFKHKSKVGRQGPSASHQTERMLEKAVMNTKEATARCARYDVLFDKASLKKMLRLYDQLEEAISLGRDRINNRPSDKELRRALSTAHIDPSSKEAGP